ncbi:ATP-binding protein [Streptomyces sp. NPDC085479]|uniref:ATP-binding protein n=1 Tax=Streptomyces sp. NPDC085479 TaxID=3365726 RepID=UPI0037D88784
MPIAIATASPTPPAGRPERPYRVTMPRRPDAVRLARSLVPFYLADHPGLVDPATLIVSELVTNAVTHTTSAVIGMEVHTAPQVVTVRVIDGSPRLPARHGADPDAWNEYGRGLRIVALCADTWGAYPVMRVHRHPYRLASGWGRPAFSHKCVWAALREAPR